MQVCLSEECRGASGIHCTDRLRGRSLATYRERAAFGAQQPCGWIGVQVSPMTRAFGDSLGMTGLYGGNLQATPARQPRRTRQD